MKAGLAADAVLRGLATAHMITATGYIVVCTGDDHVAALLGTLDTAEELDMDSRKPANPATDPTTDHVVITKPKREAEGKRKYRYNGGEKVECPQCHNQVSAMYMLKDGSKCKMCAIKAKRLAKSQEPEKSQPAVYQETWTNKKPEFGRQENRAEKQAKPKETIQLAGLRGRKVG
jgi:hypothetical protein